MIGIALVMVIGYFAFWIYTYFAVLKIQKALSDRFPEHSDKYLGNKEVLGINSKTGLLFLWDRNIIELSKEDEKVESLRIHAVRCLVVLIVALFLMPISVFFLWWFVF